MNRFLMIDRASSLSGASVRTLLQLGAEGELSIYAKGDWFWCSMENPDQRWNIREPIFLNDLNQISMLSMGITFQLHIDVEGRFISSRGCIDNDYLDGVSVNEKNLYCLKSEIEKMNGCVVLKNKTSKKPNIKSYEKYKTSLDALVELGVDLKQLTVEVVFNRVRLTDKDLWVITYATFQRNVWPIYSKEYNLGKQPGRPPNK